MASDKFIAKLEKNIKKELKKVISRPPEITSMGDPSSQSKGLTEEMKMYFIPFYGIQYIPKEYIHARIFVKNELLPYFDMVVPIVNIRNKSVQGVATFSASIPYPILETYVLRPIGLSNMLVPHRFVVQKNADPKKVIEKGGIHSKAISIINSNKKLRKVLKGNVSCFISGLGVNYTCDINPLAHPPGMFTVIPYYGHTILISKDAGISLESGVNEPKYHLKMRYEAMAGVAEIIARNPQAREKIGQFHLDTASLITIPPLLNHIRSSL